MLDSAISFAQHEFRATKTQITFLTSIAKMASVMRENPIKWDVEGQGEAFGYWVKLKANNKPLIIRTFVQKNALDRLPDQNLPIEWYIDAESLEFALQFFSELETIIEIQTWRCW